MARAADLPNADRDLVRAARRALKAVAVEEDAAPMQRYMKSAMPFMGAKKPARVAATKPLWKQHLQTDWPSLRDTVLLMWRGAKHREERYAAIDYACQRRHRPLHGLESLPTFEEMIVSGAWWDYVDWIAKENVGTILRAAPKKVGTIMRRWAGCDDLWKRRAAILSQLAFKDETDGDLLEACIAPSLGTSFALEHRGPGRSQGRVMSQKDVNFFLRKAIGWSLRQYGASNPDWVVDFAERHDDRLSKLSKTEGLRNLIKAGLA